MSTENAPTWIEDRPVRDKLLAAARIRHEEWQASESNVPTDAERDRALLLEELTRVTVQREEARDVARTFMLERNKLKQKLRAIERELSWEVPGSHARIDAIRFICTGSFGTELNVIGSDSDVD